VFYPAAAAACDRTVGGGRHRKHVLDGFAVAALCKDAVGGCTATEEEAADVHVVEPAAGFAETMPLRTEE